MFGVIVGCYVCKYNRFFNTNLYLYQTRFKFVEKRNVCQVDEGEKWTSERLDEWING